MACRPQHIPVVEIEVTTVCNWKCTFCPVAYTPKPAASMSMELFEHILDKSKIHGTVGCISINSYNEPSIDPLFIQRCEAIASRGFKLFLHTNGSGLSDTKIARLKELDNIQQITFNVPSLNPEVFRERTGGALLSKSQRAYDECIAAGFRVDFIVNGNNEEVRAELPSIRSVYPDQLKAPAYNTPVPNSISNDRAGILDNKYNQKIGITMPRLAGCVVPNNWLYINVHGDLFLCCIDYHQKNKYGNIRDGSIADLINSPRAAELFSKVDGDIKAPDDFICRSCSLMLQSVINQSLIRKE